MTSSDLLEIDIGIDGLPIYKSSKTSVWPILGAFVDQPYVSPFLIGIFCGVGHPSSLDDYLEEFLNEAKGLEENGVLA